VIVPGTTVGDDAIIGAGSVVTRDVAAGATVVGNPARPVRSRDPDIGTPS
jgi:maltose O-acetyltransferase